MLTFDVYLLITQTVLGIDWSIPDYILFRFFNWLVNYKNYKVAKSRKSRDRNRTGNLLVNSESRASRGNL